MGRPGETGGDQGLQWIATDLNGSQQITTDGKGLQRIAMDRNKSQIVICQNDDKKKKTSCYFHNSHRRSVPKIGKS